jgi:hypothetical protein
LGLEESEIGLVDVAIAIEVGVVAAGGGPRNGRAGDAGAEMV